VEEEAIQNREIPNLPGEPEPPEKFIQGNQEDVDLLVAFEEANGVNHVLLLEAKLESPWSNKQMKSKAKRFAAIFDDAKRRAHDVGRDDRIIPHFALASAAIKPPENLDTTGWPSWMLADGTKPVHVQIQGPANALRVVRCDHNGNEDAQGDWFRVNRGNAR
jgi:hypothetical protein